MTRMRILAALAAAALLPACTANAGREFSAANASQIRSGVTAKADVERSLGPPYRRQIAADGTETWLYFHNRVTDTPGPTAFIPIVGPLLPGSANASSDTEQLTVKFRGDTVVECKLQVSSSSSSKPAAAGNGVAVVAEAVAGSGSGVTQDTNCGDGPGR